MGKINKNIGIILRPGYAANNLTADCMRCSILLFVYRDASVNNTLMQCTLLCNNIKNDFCSIYL